jgi:hypothetical protein
MTSIPASFKIGMTVTDLYGVRWGIETTPQPAQNLVFCHSDLDKSITVCKMGSEGFAQTLFGFGKSIHVHKVHVYEVHASEMHAHEVHACKMHVYKVHACEIHAREVHACEMHVYEVHTHEMHACGIHAMT